MVCYIYHKTCGAYMSEHKRKRKWMTHTNIRVYLLEIKYQSTSQDHNLLLIIFYSDVTTGVRRINRFLSLSIQLGQGSNQCLIGHIIIRSRKVSNPWDWVLSVPVIWILSNLLRSLTNSRTTGILQKPISILHEIWHNHSRYSPVQNMNIQTGMIQQIVMIWNIDCIHPHHLFTR